MQRNVYTMSHKSGTFIFTANGVRFGGPLADIVRSMNLLTYLLSYAGQFSYCFHGSPLHLEVKLRKAATTKSTSVLQFSDVLVS